MVQRLQEGQLDGAAGLEEIAAQFELSSRQIRRVVQSELGVPPMQLLLTRRLLLAKQLLTETRLPITEVAFASGFSSLRRFNDAFSSRYGMPPTRLRRRAAAGSAAPGDGGTSTLLLAYRPPYDWAGMLSFLSARALTGIEHVTATTYARTVQLGDAKGWIAITQSRKKSMRSSSSFRTRSRRCCRRCCAACARCSTSTRVPTSSPPSCAATRGSSRPFAPTRGCGCRERSTDSRWGCAPSSGSRSR
jgi:AraC-like DNA-binding protein